MSPSPIRPVHKLDLPALKAVIDSTDLFPSEWLDEMIAPFWEAENETEHWLTYEEEGRPVGVAYFAPERMTEGTFNLYLIALHADFQGGGRGEALLTYVEELLRKRGERILLVETSGLPEFDRTRAFYLRCGYTQEARIREFYAAGDDKIVFWKSLLREKG